MCADRLGRHEMMYGFQRDIYPDIERWVDERESTVWHSAVDKNDNPSLELVPRSDHN
jgi:hypothetical protein